MVVGVDGRFVDRVVLKGRRVLVDCTVVLCVVVVADAKINEIFVGPSVVGLSDSRRRSVCGVVLTVEGSAQSQKRNNKQFDS